MNIPQVAAVAEVLYAVIVLPCILWLHVRVSKQRKLSGDFVNLALRRRSNS